MTKILKDQIRHDVVLEDGDRIVGGVVYRPDANGTMRPIHNIQPTQHGDAAPATRHDFVPEDALSPQQREDIVSYLDRLHGNGDSGYRLTMLAKSDAYLSARYEAARGWDRRTAEADHVAAVRTPAEPAARADADNFDAYGRRLYSSVAPEALRADAASAEAAYQRSRDDLNAWRTRADADCQSVHGGLPQRAQAHPQPAARADAASAEAAYRKNVDNLNAWRDGE